MEEWAARADKVCASAQARLAKIEPPAQLEEVPDYVAATRPIVDEELTQLRAIPRPDDDRVGVYLAKIDAALKAAREVAAAAARGDETEARTSGQNTQGLTREASNIASELGAKTCSSQ